MATPGRPAKNPSALQRPAPAQQPRDPDATDPNAVLADITGDDDEGTIADSPMPEDVPEVASGDKTQVYDANRGAEAEDSGLARFKLVVLAGPKAGAEFELGEEPITVGRGADNALSIPDVSVSRRHARIEREGADALRVTDLNSGNGTKIGDERISEAVVRHGEEFAVGDTVLQVVEIGAPAVKKGRARSPSGETGAPSAQTRGELPKARGPQPPPAPAAAPVAAPAPSGGLSPAKKKLYAAVAVVLVAFVALALVRRPPRPPVDDTSGAAGVDVAAVDQLVSEGKRLAKKRQWSAAAAKFEEAAALVDDPGVAKWLSQSKTEAAFEVQLSEGRKFLESGEFSAAKEKLAGVPQQADVYQQAQEALSQVEGAVQKAASDARLALTAGDRDRARDLARKVLAADPGNPGAQGVLSDLEKRVAKGGGGTGLKRVTVRPKEPVREDVKPVTTAASGPAVAAYLAGELGKAVKLAEDADDQRLLKNLRAFDANYREGMAKAQAQRASDAVKALGLAARADRDIAQGKPSKPGREVGKQLANMEYLLGIDCKGDDQLDAAARHFRAALDADAEHELSKKMLGKIYQRARDLFMEAYLIKGTEPERARKMFKKVADTLPADDEKQGKAKSWVEKLEGKGE